ncbi:UNVERIFIED_CONTAM: hypothetical protein Sradi_0483100 [Sesamum radiatum]|uniref:Uncharacterized protein n=1 Tax=Sesamum radiatum TaxID=300843 RepID=A0AAW2W850_SESRA
MSLKATAPMQRRMWKGPWKRLRVSWRWGNGLTFYDMAGAVEVTQSLKASYILYDVGLAVSFIRRRG